MDDDNFETTLFEEGLVKITNIKVDFGYEIHELANITSAELISVNETHSGAHAVFYIGIIIACIILGNLHIDSFLEFLKYGFYLCGSVVLLTLLGMWLLPPDTVYKVNLVDLKGEPEISIFRTGDKSQAQRIVDTINDAISRRKQL
ncbi:MAG TPA: hypothetical protein DCX54_07590 [Flavobacteriales bacterium]|nr:hypothetical protein [Flavobacteriales bacterium]